MNQLVINPRVGWRFIGDEVVCFNCNNQQILIWNETASQLWWMLANGQNKQGLADWLRTSYSLDCAQAEYDVEQFLQDAYQGGFLYADQFNNNLSADFDATGENVLLTVEMKAIQCRIPFAVTLETTYACNENCVHCYMEKEKNALSTDEIKQVLTELADAGTLFLTLTGGEFFTRSDALAVIEYASSLHFVIDILSNGTLITAGIAQKIAEQRVRRIQVSLYGANPTTHDQVTRHPGSFSKTITGIKLARAQGIKVEIAYPMMKQNFHERYQVLELAESLRCQISVNHIITARNDGTTDTYDLRIDDEQMKAFFDDEKLSSLYTGRKPFQDHQFYLGLSELLDAPPCYSGINSCAITPSGKVLPCNQFLYEVGDLRQKSFSSIWAHSARLEDLRKLTLRDLHACCNCSLLSQCTRCPGLALLEHGDLLGPSPENCRVSRIYTLIGRKEVKS